MKRKQTFHAFRLFYNCCNNASQSIAGYLPVGLHWNFVYIGTDSLKKPPIQIKPIVLGLASLVFNADFGIRRCIVCKSRVIYNNNNPPNTLNSY